MQTRIVLEQQTTYRVGTTFPENCSTGSLFFKTDAPPGVNLFGCVSGTWVLLGGGGGHLPFMVALDPTRTTLRVGTDCSTATPCRVRIGSKVYTYTAPVTLPAPSGSAHIWIFVDGNTGSIVTSTSLPPWSLPLWRWQTVSSQWSAAGEDFRAFLSLERAIFPGPGISVTEQPASVQIARVP